MEDFHGNTLRPDTGLSASSHRSRRSQTSGAPSSRHTYASAGISETSGASRVDFMRVPPRNQRHTARSLSGAGRLCTSALPGYAGYIPAKVAENVYGHTFQATTERAAREAVCVQAQVPTSFTTRTIDGPRPGMEVPGYTGFCPGRYADNVMAQTHARGGETAFQHKKNQEQERVTRVNYYRQGIRPPTGNADYGGYRSTGA
eukprot:CAMPEP_0206489618 /NCGR_PEP_ID=MMETSP0324_2-20121206/43396_1 /ASSEMBLY_ACC=CAM_ASM_000836 /TAXON_ID=2866 /ORGANISM="Crypthecodinium cohnii, Strain Seligo" /LENGTH=201 /DNA_ID=CAMNT_0053969429 /DNA_START=151 /DNA_END=752 /DNA_ORIENTATION=+